MITGISGSYFFNNNKLQNQKQINRVSFGKLEADDSFENHQNKSENGFLRKIKQKTCNFVGTIQGKIVTAYLSIIQKGYRNEKELEYLDKLGKEFIKTPEGIRRSVLSDEIVKKEFEQPFNKAFDELEVPEELRPKLVVKSNDNIMGGGYKIATHSIEINSNSYRNCPITADSVIMHEATHAKEALMRSGIPQNRVDEIVKNKLLSNSNDVHILNSNTLSFMMPLEMPDEMKQDFNEFADKNLFNKSQKVNSAMQKYNLSKEMQSSNVSPEEYTPIIRKIVGGCNKELKSIFNGIDYLIDKYPEFVKKYGGRDSAFNALMDYSLALNTEYNLFTNTKVGGEFGTKQVKVKELTGDELEQAEKSLINHMDTIRGNILFSKDVNVYTSAMYLFSPEEVLAETNGRKFLIKNYQQELDNFDVKLTPDREIYLKAQIELSKKVIEHRTLGSEYLELIKEYVTHTDNEGLEQAVNNKAKEVNNLKKQIIELEKKLGSYEAM